MDGRCQCISGWGVELLKRSSSSRNHKTVAPTRILREIVFSGRPLDQSKLDSREQLKGELYIHYTRLARK